MGQQATELIHRYAGGGFRRIAESAGLTITSGKGSFLIDSDGRRYLDVTTAYGVAGIGHSHPRWVAAVREQAGLLAATPFHTPLLGDYLEALAGQLAPSLQRLALFSGGTEAAEVAIRIAQRATGRQGVLSFTNAFHGKTAGVRFTGGAHDAERQALSTSDRPHAAFPACESHSATTYPACDDSAAGLCAELATSSGLEDVAAVLVEPVLGTAGNVPPAPDFIGELRRLCDRRGWLLIADESITGFGRTGPMFAYQRFSSTPDILVLGKAIGGGFPLSAVATSADLWAASGMDQPSTTSSSYGGNPLACAAGLAVLDILTEPGFCDHADQVTAQLAAGVDALAVRSPAISRPRGVGFMLGFDLVDPATGDLASLAACAKVFRACLDGGLLLPADVPRVRLNPPMTLTLPETDLLFDILGEVLP